MDMRPLFQNRWTDRFAFDIALALEGSGEPVADILENYNMEITDLLEIRKDKVFQQRVEQYRAEIKTKGLTFRLKARAQAEELLTTSWLLIHDSDVSPAVKADLIKSTVKWAGLEPKGDDPVGTNDVRITINLGDAGSAPRTIAPLTVEADN